MRTGATFVAGPSDMVTIADHRSRCALTLPTALPTRKTYENPPVVWLCAFAALFALLIPWLEYMPRPAAAPAAATAADYPALRRVEAASDAFRSTAAAVSDRSQRRQAEAAGRGQQIGSSRCRTLMPQAGRVGQAGYAAAPTRTRTSTSFSVAAARRSPVNSDDYERMPRSSPNCSSTTS